MTLEFRFMSRRWVVYGHPDEMRQGPVQVQRKNGEVKTETIIKLSQVFDTPDGPRQVGFVRELPKRPRSKHSRPQYNFPVEVRKIGE